MALPLVASAAHSVQESAAAVSAACAAGDLELQPRALWLWQANLLLSDVEEGEAAPFLHETWAEDAQHTTYPGGLDDSTHPDEAGPSSPLPFPPISSPLLTCTTGSTTRLLAPLARGLAVLSGGRKPATSGSVTWPYSRSSPASPRPRLLRLEYGEPRIAPADARYHGSPTREWPPR